MTTALEDAGLASAGIDHGFGLRGTPQPSALRRPRQVHGAVVVSAERCEAVPAPEADAVVTAAAGVCVGVVTADCVPVLVSTPNGNAVAAIHAGWRGLAAGVVAAAVDALRHAAGGRPEEALLAAIGPHIGPCCYEVDAPVIARLAARFGAPLDAALEPSERSGHAMLALAALVRADLESCGLSSPRIGELSDACTRCDPLRFHSYRRDGPRAGRLVHFIRTRGEG